MLARVLYCTITAVADFFLAKFDLCTTQTWHMRSAGWGSCSRSSSSVPQLGICALHSISRRQLTKHLPDRKLPQMAYAQDQARSLHHPYSACSLGQDLHYPVAHATSSISQAPCTCTQCGSTPALLYLLLQVIHTHTLQVMVDATMLCYMLCSIHGGCYNVMLYVAGAGAQLLRPSTVAAGVRSVLLRIQRQHQQ